MITFGRVMLSSLFLLSIWLDVGEPEQSHTYAFLLFYVVLSLALALAGWSDWWLDARLALPSHLIDMAMFTAAVFSTDGYTSPFFLFFILPLLSAAIRWGWRETALTATALILLYLTAGLLVAGTQVFEMQRFIVRSGHLLILSAVLIWFGIHQKFARPFFSIDDLDRRMSRDEDPLRQALDLAMGASAARSGALLVRSRNGQRFAGLSIVDGAARPASIERPLMPGTVPVALFRLDRDRSLTTRADGWYRFMRATRLLDGEELAGLGADEGLIAEVGAGTHQGWLLLWDIPDLSVDFLEVGAELGRAAGAVLDRDVLLSAIEEGVAARTRLSLARDVHDSVVQFLAGAAFRVEAIRRGSKGHEQVESDLKELKRLLIEEQGEIRAFVSALRRDRELELPEAVEELKAVARRLGDQWSIDCRVDASEQGASIPMRLQLDLQQLLREAVANAVRHGGASRIDVDVGVEDGGLRMQVTDNGSGFGPANGDSLGEPWSLKERVDRANGSLSLHSEPGCTNVVITLPLTHNGAAA